MQSQEAQLDLCTIDDSNSITVAHAVSYDETMKTLIHRLKYNHDRLIARDLSQLLQKAFTALKATLPQGELKFVPVPLSCWRMRQRGFNQAELLARHIQYQAQVSMSTKMLARNRHTKPQHKLNKQERAENLRQAFRYTNKSVGASELNLILVDDIHTSGSTLAAAATALQVSGAKGIAAITVARAILLNP